MRPVLSIESIGEGLSMQNVQPGAVPAIEEAAILTHFGGSRTRFIATCESRLSWPVAVTPIVDKRAKQNAIEP